MPTDQEYRQWREQREVDNKGKHDSCFVCGRRGEIGDDLHVLLKVMVGMNQTLTSFLAAHDEYAVGELTLPTPT